MPEITPEELWKLLQAKRDTGSWPVSTYAAIASAADTIERLQARIAELEQQVAELESWGGLMATFDKLYPEDVVPTRADDATRDPGSRIVSLIRQVAAMREKNRKMEIIVRERTHRKIGCLCERCLEHEFQVAELVAALRADAERLDIIINGMSTRDVADCHLCGRLREAADAARDRG